MSFSMFEFVLSIFVLMVSTVMIISIPWTTSVMVISLSIILVCIIRSSWKKYTNRYFPPHEETNRDFSLEQPSMAVDEVQRSILASRKKYAVFISFRGEDTRSGFISHLGTALKNAGINYFIDDDKLERGHEISQALLEAIDDSTFCLVVFSENYATSWWCLDELVHTIQRMQEKLQIVLPVFYHVDPSDVRKQKGSYADAFVKLEQRYKDSMIAKWKVSLTLAANLSGWDLSKIKNEAELVSAIVNHIREKLRSTSSTCYLKEGLVGIEKSVADLKTLLSNSPMVGIYGMGGLGKTTLADVVFKQLRYKFDNYCFLENFREQLEKHGSTYVEDKFFKTLSGEENMVLENLDSVKERLRHKKLLIVLDDALEECHSLLIKDHRAWLNSESKVIITSRDKQVLRNIIGDDDDEKMCLYGLEILNEKEALELFNLHAFKGKAVDQNYKELSEEFVDYAKGLPLALKVLGSHVHSKSKNVWQSMLSKLKEVNPDQGIVKVLRISFDGLEELEKSIFLDIACFFRGNTEKYAKDALDACYGSSCDVAIEVLVDKCLIIPSKISKHDIFEGIILEMHDLLQEMGQSIACESDDRCLENYSRLWRLKDICHVLENNMGTSKIKGISFYGYGIQEGEINLDPSVFKEMSSLKLLKLSTHYDWNIPFQLPHGLDSLPMELRYLEWEGYPSKSLGSILTLGNLVHLGMPWSQLEKLWDGIQDLKSLKYVNLNRSKKLTCLPNLSRANLCHLGLQGCESLVELPPLRFHDVHDGKLNLFWCHNLRIVSEMFGNIKLIDLSWTAIEELHSSIGSLKDLHELYLSYCKHLKKLPSSICYSESLERLYMSGCVSIDKFPELPKNIKGLDLSETSIRQINSSSFECMPSLESLKMENCTMLESLPTTICNKLKSLVKLCFSNCSQLKSFSEILEPMENLEELYLNGTSIDAVPQPIEYLPKLTILDLSKCENLKSIPISNIYNMPNISSVHIDEYHVDQDWAVLSDVWISETLQQSKCRCSCSNTNLISILKLYALCDNFKFWKDFTCCECVLFFTIHNILVTKAQQDKIFKVTSRPMKKVLNGRNPGNKIPQWFGPRVSFCYPGNKIPQWFAYTSTVCALQVDSAPSIRNGDESLLGIVICLVVDFDWCFLYRDELTIVCEIHYYSMDKPDLVFFQPSFLQIQKRTQYDTDHAFICYLTREDIIDDLYGARNASFKSFEFYMKNKSYDKCGDKRIKGCGIHFVYKKDVEEFDTIHAAEPHNGKRTKISKCS